MPRNSGGTYTLPAGNPVITGTTISSVWANTTLSDIATEMTDSLDRSGKGPMLASLQLFDGLIGAPGLNWSTETTSGLYRAGAGDFRYSIAATDKLQITTNGTRTNDGVVGTPSWSFISDPDTGVYRIGANDFGFSTNGVLRLEISTAAVTATIPVFITDGILSNPAFAFSNDPDTGVIRPGTNTFRIVAGGSISASFTPNQLALEDGSVGSPGLTFNNDPDTGILRPGANTLRISAGGANSASFTMGQILGEDGTVSLPGFSFNVDPDTGFYRDTANQIAIALAGVAAGQIAQGSFTGTITGCTTSPTGTIAYQRIGNIVTLWCEAGVTGTSNASTLTMTGLPAIVQPAGASKKVFSAFMTDGTAGSVAIGVGQVLAGTATFSIGSTSGGLLISTASAWTASGTKGLSAGWTMTYSVA